ncbi:MBL fold metallo-hydrolase [Vacuolonema iberomarrocanum]|uniref:MBL fold metallo-hydrolase n=1 Tax=Vacuolonema iberomarrocanum TaxID=3454632 RepID=UPI0019E4AD33|nr:MBL fold metallo-hydrolase [filamentous cyanobacterium LEGE 07170]
MYLTYLDSNSWLIDLEHTRILLDPWLVGDLVFGGAKWLFRGYREAPRTIPEDIDVILLSQGLEDHAHPETLKALDRTIPVIASPNAAKVVEGLGYENVTALEHGKSYVWQEQVKFKALPGSPIGPLLTENAYLVTDMVAGKRLYYEPHGYHDATLKTEPPVDVVITPLINLELPLVGPFIKGQESALKIAQWLKPQVMLPTAAGGDIEFEGMLLSVLKAKGSTEAFQQMLTEKGLKARVIEPTAGDRIAIDLEPSIA